MGSPHGLRPLLVDVARARQRQQEPHPVRLVATVAVAAASAAAAAAAAGAAASAAVAAASAAAALPWLGLVDGQAASARLLAVEAGDGGLRLRVGAHLDEAEALGAAGVAVHDDLRRLHGAEGAEQLLQFTVRHA